ncbi:hypothetical protein EV383_0389 [Pseudonocardia sediminis]|uniref:Uncharacterized protein n=1 Tax=Pseudonocardia sediminis TaxID=1397368 RepID=A0A4V2FQ71_PSEST|nr:hypothetical protein [Pseudonocardia sediminis]RZT83580.1 hypothetical protein EV383_0389 [Pseudonocardia sediminis]
MRAAPRPRRGSALTVGAVLALASLVGCGTLPPPVPVTPTITPAASADGVRSVRFDHRPGALQPPATVVAVPRGAVVDLVVGSDVAERVTLQGYGWSRYVTAGSTVSLRFVVDRPGELTVTVGDPGVELGRLQVR